MPRLETIEVRKGDFNTKYLNLMGFGSAHNRILKEDHAKKLLKSWPTVEGSLVELVDDGSDLHIINGQHRIYAASTFMNSHISRFSAVIYSMREIEARGLSLLEHTVNANAGKPQNVNDLLAMHQDRSVWLEAFKDNGLYPEMKQGNGVLMWANILRAHAAVRMSLNGDRFYSASSSTVTRDMTLSEWMSAPETEVASTAFILRWWTPAAEKAKEQQRVNSLFSANALYAALLIYHLNFNSPVIQEAPYRLLEWSELPSLSRWGRQGNAKQMAEAILYGMNYKRTTNLLKVFGVTGREGR